MGNAGDFVRQVPRVLPPDGPLIPELREGASQ